MSVLAVGVSHRSSPVALLERVALDDDTRRKAMSEMANSSAVNEVMMVSTCNRTEIYADVDKFHAALTTVTELLSWHTGVPLGELSQHLYVHYDERAVQHLFSVTCGLDSMVVGEGQILGQVRDALKDAQAGGTLGRVLNDLGQRALRVGKRAHTETHIDHAGAGMVALGIAVAGRHLGIEPAAAEQPFGNATPTGEPSCPAGHSEVETADAVEAALPQPRALTGIRVLVLGAGSMSALSANTVARQGASTVLVANRTHDRAARLAECLTEAYDSIDSRAVPFEQATDVLDDVDLVVSCTGAQGLVLTREIVENVARRRSSTRPLVFLDLALPHDIDAGVRELTSVRLVDIEDLRHAVAQGDTPGMGEVGPAVAVVREIVDEEVAEYQSVRRAELVAPTVVALRSKARTVLDTELARLHGRLPDLDDKTRDEVSYAMRRVVDKLLHQPTVRVKELAAGPDGDSYEAALRELFDLDPNTPGAVTTPDPGTRGQEWQS